MYLIDVLNTIFFFVVERKISPFRLFIHFVRPPENRFADLNAPQVEYISVIKMMNVPLSLNVNNRQGKKREERVGGFLDKQILPMIILILNTAFEKLNYGSFFLYIFLCWLIMTKPQLNPALFRDT